MRKVASSTLAARLFAVGALGSTACNGVEEPPVVGSSRYVEFASSVDYEVCEVNLRRLDAYIETVYAELGAELPDDLLLRYNYAPQWKDLPKGCPSSGGCALPPGELRDISTVFSDSPLHYHEIAHTISYDVWPGRHPSALSEGFAERYSSPDTWFADLGWQWESTDVEMMLELGGEYYDVAAILAAAIVQGRGEDAYFAYMQAMAGESGARSLEVYEELAGETLQQTFDAAVPFQTCLRPYALCSEPPVAWADAELRLPTAPSCDTPGLAYSGVAATGQGDVFERRYVIEASELISVEATVPEWVEMRVLPCDPTCSVNDEGVNLGEGSGSFDLQAGQYEVMIWIDKSDLGRDGEVVIREP